MRLTLLLLLVFTSAGWGQAKIPPISPADLARMKRAATRALDAWNAGDWRAFFADWADKVAALRTESQFQEVYLKTYGAQFGKILSREFSGAQMQSVTGRRATLYYHVKCARQNGSVYVNFYREQGVYKIEELGINRAR